MLSRVGRVESVIIGDHKKIVIPALSHIRSAGGRLKGLRCIHTHLAGEDITDDDLMDLLFLRLDLMAMIKVTEDGLPERLYAVHLLPSARDGKSWHFLEPVVASQQTIDFRHLISALEDEFTRSRSSKDVDGTDRAILVSVTTKSKSRAGESMDELVELVRSDDVIVAKTVIQKRKRINPKLILGKGKLGEIMLAALQTNANLLIFDQELNPSQVRSITDHTELRVIDRTQLILDIFARRALSREGKLQIEMAQLKYLLPRLGQRDDALSRLKKVSKERHHRRSRRRKKELPVISLVGYTNAGKSTLLNSLTNSKILAEDKLFATLDPTSRRLRFPEDVEVIITDTVGFIRELPDELLQAFKATLEELQEADLLVHVIDVSNPRFVDQIQVVESLLDDLDLSGIKILRVFNKIDLVDQQYVENQLVQYKAIALSAIDPTTCAPFMQKARSYIVKKWDGFTYE